MTVAEKTPAPIPNATITEAPWLGVLRDTLGRVLDGVARDQAPAFATLAEWRRGLGKEPMQEPRMWHHMVPIVERVPDSPGRQRQVEEAVHHALVLFALHQQSRPEPMHVNDQTSLGAACRRLATAEKYELGVRRRMYAAATADSVAELVGHLRGLVALLRTERIPLDYCRLAREIATWRNRAWRSGTRRSWGRDFEARPRPTDDQTDGKTDDSEGEATS